MARKPLSLHCDHQKELAKLLRELAYRHGLWQVWKDFVAMSALSIANAVDRRQWTAREDEYLKIAGRYTKDEAEGMARGLALVTLGLEVGMSDFLGSLFMALELGDAWKGQFFTPYDISRLMASMTLGDKGLQEIQERGFVTVSDPCIGGGAMVIAAAHALQDQGINYQQCMHAVACDIDIVAVHMAYIQCSLLHIPAVIYHCNSISLEVWSQWQTPAHVLGFWDAKLNRCGLSRDLTGPAAEGKPSAENTAPVRAQVQPLRVKTIDIASPPVVAAASAAVDLRGQLHLF
jgi:hypothetical protein